MKTFVSKRLKILDIHIGSEGGFIRIPSKGHGLCLTRSIMLFSERMGHTKYLKLPFGWRLKFLNKLRERGKLWNL